MSRRIYPMHLARASRNKGLGLTLAVFCLLVFGLTVVKLSAQTEAANAPISAQTR
ncbi:hypothetical protein [Thioclava sp. GXIMD4216]|uniref:Uncharacterized protein n=1 Tax=Thioclava litoralis TaxID=3076557 RepID=A0ABZ1E057_9RHOB|nr:hypothetical protein RPE78_03895 [Thioclava sp. FTW29]